MGCEGLGYLVVKPTLYFGHDWGLGKTQSISIKRIAKFHQIQSKGFVLGLEPYILILYIVLSGKNLVPNLQAGLE